MIVVPESDMRPLKHQLLFVRRQLAKGVPDISDCADHQSLTLAAMNSQTQK